jgi:predicted molibdopterin-dependent oxidoreductase YjgC
MYKIESDTIQKIVAIQNLLNQLEVRGTSNVGIMYNVLLGLQQITDEIEKSNKFETISIDNTKKGG